MRNWRRSVGMQPLLPLPSDQLLPPNQPLLPLKNRLPFINLPALKNLPLNPVLKHRPALQFNSYDFYDNTLVLSHISHIGYKCSSVYHHSCQYHSKINITFNKLLIMKLINICSSEKEIGAMTVLLWYIHYFIVIKIW